MPQYLYCMPKTNGANGKVLTHFETVPLEIVKEIAVEDCPTDQKFDVAIENAARPAIKRPRMPVPTRAPAAKKR